ncbi:MAG: hypothetical protein ACK6DF_13060, partial [Betaproteobacteria bacterium]
MALAQQEQQEQPATTAAENTPQESVKPDEPAAGSIDGVTGDISLGPGHQFRREPVAAQFVQGVP